MRCVHCGWLGQHGTFECVAHLSAQLAAARAIADAAGRRSLDVRDLRAALAQVRAVAS